MELAGSIISLIGAIFLFLGSLGILRMPDTYNRIQTGTKATTLGTILFLIGIGFFHPLWAGKLFLLILFIFFTNPISSHALGRAALYNNIPLTDLTVVNKFTDDSLEDDDEQKEEGEE